MSDEIDYERGVGNTDSAHRDDEMLGRVGNTLRPALNDPRFLAERAQQRAAEEARHEQYLAAERAQQARSRQDQLRGAALAAALQSHGGEIDVAAIVKAAKAYADFLSGETK